MPSSKNAPAPRVALIGVTGYGSIYLHLVREALLRNEIRLVAAVIVNQSEVPEIVAELRAHGTVIYTDSDSFFSHQTNQVDLCLIPVGIQWHARLTLRALQCGMNVLVEKPLAGSVEDCTAIRRAETASGRWVAVGFQDLYSLEALWLKNQLLAGTIGRIEDIRMIGLWPRARSYFTRNHWAGRVSADGAATLDSPLNNAFAHFINLALFFIGPSPGESADVTVQSADLYRAHDIEMFDTAVIRGLTSTGARYWFGVSHVTEETRQPEIVIHGSAGRVEWWHEQRCAVFDAAGHRQVFPLPSTDATRLMMFSAVLEKLRSPAAFVCGTSLAEKHTRLIENVQRSGAVLRFPAASIDCIPDPATQSEIPCVRDLASLLNLAFLSDQPLSLPPVKKSRRLAATL